MAGLAHKSVDIQFLKPARGKVETTWYSSVDLQKVSWSNEILFIHSFCGCDTSTTSAFFRKGKNARGNGKLPARSSPPRQADRAKLTAGKIDREKFVTSLHIQSQKTWIDSRWAVSLYIVFAPSTEVRHWRVPFHNRPPLISAPVLVPAEIKIYWRGLHRQSTRNHDASPQRNYSILAG